MMVIENGRRFYATELQVANGSSGLVSVVKMKKGSPDKELP